MVDGLPDQKASLRLQKNIKINSKNQINWLKKEYYGKVFNFNLMV